VAPPGVTSVVVLGDLSKDGIYVLRNKFPANSTVPAHSHPTWRIMTVLEGAVYFGYGPKLDGQQLKRFGPGSVIVEPPNVPHYFVTKDEGAVIQFVAQGPLKSAFSR
jgi:quercetin dioxygenase-like cupin family protein